VSEGYFDVIVSDPPYGIRAGAKKTGKVAPVTYTIPEERRHDHIPSTQRYPVEEVMLDLLHTAARSLVP
jgi:tRNA (guanine10-N2)-methyltransferase